MPPQPDKKLAACAPLLRPLSGLFPVGFGAVFCQVYPWFHPNFAVLNYQAAIQFHRSLPAQKIQQNRNALTLRNHPAHHGLKTVKNAAGNFDSVARIEVLRKNPDFFISHRGTQIGNRCVRNGRPAVAKMNHVSDSGYGPHPTQLGSQIKLRKEVAGKKRLCDPCRAAPGGPTVTDSGQEHLNSQVLPELGRGNVFVFRLGLHTKPFCRFLPRYFLCRNFFQAAARNFLRTTSNRAPSANNPANLPIEAGSGTVE